MGLSEQQKLEGAIDTFRRVAISSESKYLREMLCQVLHRVDLGYYDPDYGDHTKCVCSHAYSRHFDSYENMYPRGCKYCSCRTFKAAES